MSNRTLGLSDAVYEYLLEASLREPPELRTLREETAKMPEANMQISPEQGQFMALLARLMDARRCIEVGVFTGYSSLALALALPESGRIVACDVSEEWARVARRYWREAGIAHKIDLRIAPAIETLRALRANGGDGSYDFAFVDADKTSYGDYYEKLLKLLRPGGLIVIDNTLWAGKVADPDVQDKDTIAIREFNARLVGDQRIDLSLVPIADGVTLARKR
ncbi:MAG TPA: class I SAM-dependent methyltransferase [Gammaproteobacteria bacterium]|nr:class I SAM-dependent methyltransferase [Gammaproteobacteria bacterium]